MTFLTLIGVVSLMGCGEAVESSQDSPELEGVQLTVGGDNPIEVHLAGAWLDPGGSGHGVEATAKISSTPPLEINGDRSSWDLSRSKVSFEDNVIVTRDDVTMTCDSLLVTYRKNRVEQAEAIGGVVVTKGEVRATAEKALLTVDDGRVVLTGNATVVQGPHKMTGAAVTLFLDDEKVECRKCRVTVEGDAVAPIGSGR